MSSLIGRDKSAEGMYSTVIQLNVAMAGRTALSFADRLFSAFAVWLLVGFPEPFSALLPLGYSNFLNLPSVPVQICPTCLAVDFIF